ncbi:Peptidoglycan/LPS O-acetylase OafA/YrhL, contains acyltransferase and SGNH-hydrolase domains [Amycolatopsis xylanica]|uniref:Peptidoglycan/LPS O-acetylase OafA/YrhL, contains acyltransferase and SGNH-hydrolase domains n=1 Tax=Amycolatopsis xylanica TaxID=589385 RepID=A0A1H3RYW7_9PSEU|nr:acyltransferase family protein [Amycolatopsis xylanica]SDZ30884.1 Peptidoglycan/LPS O-acetylase OafA/YrhL, contains acyltransferase and SGNH-hydrolase domains [Amycolatopsis xylanica]
MAAVLDAVTGSPARPQKPAQRLDIQGLRALAVGLVVFYHLRPTWLPGGFIGVDVFFVISGFLIIGTLTSEIRRTGRLGLLEFYARRLRRLVPAATAVLLVTVAATVLLAPVSRWPDVFREVVSAALNVQNWTLAVLSSDYAHATATASPVQHFWSLAVEEQFYLVIPLILLTSAVLAARKKANPARWAFGAVVLVSVVSFAFSVLFTPAHHGAAYFITPTRMWELGIGGLAAIALHRLRLGGLAQLLLGWIGLAAVVVSAVTLTTEMAFPGWIAAIPTLGTVALLLAGDGNEHTYAEITPYLSVPPLRYIGDISYSLYLWHWPVIVFLLEQSGNTHLSAFQVVVASALSFALAAASKRFIEDPFRKPKRRRVTYLLGVAMVATSVIVATVPWHFGQAKLDDLAARSALTNKHPGALALSPVEPSPVPTGVPIVPDPAIARDDFPLLDRPGCATYDFENKLTGSACGYGNPNATKTVVLLGDSHAAMYSTALAEYVGKHTDWRLKVVVRNGCPFTATAPSEAGIPLTNCADFNQTALESVVALRPNLVITAAMSPQSYVEDLEWTWPSRSVLVDGYRTVLTRLSEANIPVAVIREIPRPSLSVPACLQRNPDRAACDTRRQAAFPSEGDPLAEAADGLSGVRIVDMTNWLCDGTSCPAVIGNVVVYRDNHLTNTYVRTLSGPLAAALGLF